MSKEQMIRREVVGSITLVRDGKRIELTTGQKFDFTKDELEQIEAADPKAVSAKSIVDLDDEASTLKVDDEKPSKANQTKAPAAKGEKAKSTEEDM